MTDPARLSTFVRDLAGRSKRSLLHAAEAEVRQTVAGMTDDPSAADATLAALATIREGSDVTYAQSLALRSIIMHADRPAWPVVDGDFVAQPPWAHLSDLRPMIRAQLTGVGRIDLPKIGPAGTGIVVGPGLLMTNHHVAIVAGPNDEIHLSPFAQYAGVVPDAWGQATFDLRAELGRPQGLQLRVVACRMKHPHLDAALLEVEGIPPEIQPLSLLETMPDRLQGREIVVIGYPKFDDRNPRELEVELLGDHPGVKRLEPGLLTGLADTTSPMQQRVTALTHDASTLGGNSGSAVLDLASGRIIGLHFGGEYMVHNFAVPSWALAADPAIRAQGVRSTDQAWRAPD